VRQLQPLSKNFSNLFIRTLVRVLLGKANG
jgi:hypothetical protein